MIIYEDFGNFDPDFNFEALSEIQHPKFSFNEIKSSEFQTASFETGFETVKDSKNIQLSCIVIIPG